MIQFSVFREAPVGDKPGPVSLRRVLAAYFALLAAALFVVPFLGGEIKSWAVFIPGGLAVVASLLLLFFTTWADISAIVSAFKGAK